MQSVSHLGFNESHTFLCGVDGTKVRRGFVYDIVVNTWFGHFSAYIHGTLQVEEKYRDVY